MSAIGTSEKLSYLDTSLSFTERVKDLIGRMTLEEKVAQCVQIYIPPEDREDILGRIRATGLGSRILSAVPLAGSVRSAEPPPEMRQITRSCGPSGSSSSAIRCAPSSPAWSGVGWPPSTT